MAPGSVLPGYNLPCGMLSNSLDWKNSSSATVADKSARPGEAWVGQDEDSGLEIGTDDRSRLGSISRQLGPRNYGARKKTGPAAWHQALFYRATTSRAECCPTRSTGRIPPRQQWPISRLDQGKPGSARMKTPALRSELTIDLGSVRFLDSSGLGIMVRAKKQAQRHGTRLCFTGLQPPVRNVVQLARLEEFLLGNSGR